MNVECPNCTYQYSEIYDSEINSTDGWMIEYHTCDNCGWLFDVHYKLILEKIIKRDE